jgi:hypothetical protein
VHVILEVIEHDAKTGKARRKSFRLGGHLEHLERICVQFQPLLLIIDPITAYMSTDTDSHATADVRSDLAPLAELAQRHGMAVLMVSHLNKATTMQALYRVTGSVAFVAAARSAFGVIRDPNDKERRYVLPLKSNLGKDTGGLAYRIAFDGRAPRIEWEPEPVNVDIDDVTAVASPRERAKQSAEDAVGVWLRDQLRYGPVAAADIWRRAKEAGHPERKVKAAIKNLGVEKAPAGYRGTWHYALPPESCNTNGSQNASNSVRLCASPAGFAEPDTTALPDSGEFLQKDAVDSQAPRGISGSFADSCAQPLSESGNTRGIIQSRTETDALRDPGDLSDSVSESAQEVF